MDRRFQAARGWKWLQQAEASETNAAWSHIAAPAVFEAACDLPESSIRGPPVMRAPGLVIVMMSRVGLDAQGSRVGLLLGLVVDPLGTSRLARGLDGQRHASGLVLVLVLVR
jgi:hypothetical protein